MLQYNIRMFFLFCIYTGKKTVSTGVVQKICGRWRPCNWSRLSTTDSDCCQGLWKRLMPIVVCRRGFQSKLLTSLVLSRNDHAWNSFILAVVITMFMPRVWKEPWFIYQGVGGTFFWSLQLSQWIMLNGFEAYVMHSLPVVSKGAEGSTDSRLLGRACATILSKVDV